MRFLPEQKQDRREFVRHAARYSLLGLLTLVALLSGRAKGSRNGRCINRGLCGRCLAFADCELPPAISTRERLNRERTSPG